jgi:hypothetical protein
MWPSDFRNCLNDISRYPKAIDGLVYEYMVVIDHENWSECTRFTTSLGLNSYQTSWTWLHKIRKALVNPNRSKLLGIVEIDETIIGGIATGKR